MGTRGARSTLRRPPLTVPTGGFIHLSCVHFAVSSTIPKVSSVRKATT
jgi:hypothetical protein